MSDEFSAYESGIRTLLENLDNHERDYKDGLILQSRLKRNIREARLHGSEPAQKNELSKILAAVNEICLLNIGKSFYEWCEMRGPVVQADVPEEIKYVEKYVGKVSALYSGSTSQELTNQLIAMGAKPKAGQKVLEEDILERYSAVPLHAVFLYTSEDEIIAPYILKNWGTLDTLSGEVCDIHPIVDQFNDIEDAYSYIKHLDVIREAGFRAISKLPGLFFWDQAGNTEYVSFGREATAAQITYILRVIFEEIYVAPEIASVTRAKGILG